MTLNDSLSAGIPISPTFMPAIPTAAEASRRTREAKDQSLQLPPQIAQVIDQAIKAGQYSVEIPQVGNMVYIKQLLESRGYTCEQIQTGMAEFGTLVRWPEVVDELQDLRGMVDKLMTLVFAGYPKSRHYPVLREYAAQHANQTYLLNLLQDFTKVYSEGVSPYHEAVRFAISGWDDPNQEIEYAQQARWLHGKGMAPYASLHTTY